MSEEHDALLALQNAWNGALATAERLREAAPTLLNLPGEASIQQIDLDQTGTLALAHANAAQALRGLVETLRRKREATG